MCCGPPHFTISTKSGFERTCGGLAFGNLIFEKGVTQKKKQVKTNVLLLIKQNTLRFVI